MYQITATGGQSETLVITDLRTGDVVKNPALTAVDVRFRSGHPIIANGTVEVIRPDLEVSSFDWLTRHPITDELAPLAALEFRDGARIEFQDNGAPVAKEAPTVAPRSETVTVTLNFEAPDLLLSVAKALFGDDVPAPPAVLTTLEMSEVIAFQLRRRAMNAGTSLDALDDFWSALRPKVLVGARGPEQQTGVPLAGLIQGEVVELPPSNLTFVASVLVEPAFDGSFIVHGSDPLMGEIRHDIDSALDVATKWLLAGEKVSEGTAHAGHISVGAIHSVIIERFRDPDGKDCYAASTSADSSGAAFGISATSTDPDWTSAESLAGVLNFARHHLAPGESGEVLSTIVDG